MKNQQNTEGKIEIIADYLCRPQSYKALDNSLFYGKAGVSMFMHYAGNYFKEPRYQSLSFELLENVMEKISRSSVSLGYCHGVLGVLWYIKHLIRYNVLDKDYSDIYADVEEFIFERGLYEIKEGKFDFLHNGLGKLYFFIYDDISCDQRGYIQRLVSELENYMHKITHYERLQLGIAHGVASILLLCTKLIEMDYCADRARVMADKIYHQILFRRNEADAFNFFNCDTRLPFNRYTWCNGTAGLLYALVRYVHTVDHGQKEEIVALAKEKARLNDHKKLGLHDACICHGTAGIMQIYNRLYNLYGYDEFKEAKKLWNYKTRLFGLFPDGIAGYKTWGGNGFLINPTLLDGLSGIGLSLMSYVDESIMPWDEVFLL